MVIQLFHEQTAEAVRSSKQPSAARFIDWNGFRKLRNSPILGCTLEENCTVVIRFMPVLRTPSRNLLQVSAVRSHSVPYRPALNCFEAAQRIYFWGEQCVLLSRRRALPHRHPFFLISLSSAWSICRALYWEETGTFTYVRFVW